MRFDAQQASQALAKAKRALATDMKGVALVLNIEGGDGHPRFHRGHHDPIVFDLYPGDVGGIAKSPFDGLLIPVAPVEAAIAMALMNLGCVVGKRRLDIDDGGQGLDLDLDLLNRISGVRFAVRYDHG